VADFQGTTRAGIHYDQWYLAYDLVGESKPFAEAATSTTVLYTPHGGVAPAKNFLVADSDYVEVLTEIDIQTPIPKMVQKLRAGRNFLFLGCRFSSQLERIFARQISKRSSDLHWAVLPEEPTRNERRFLEENGIRRIDTPLNEWVEALLALDQHTTTLRMVAG
jgi:hypothetical protein